MTVLPVLPHCAWFIEELIVVLTSSNVETSVVLEREGSGRDGGRRIFLPLLQVMSPFPSLHISDIPSITSPFQMDMT